MSGRRASAVLIALVALLVSGCTLNVGTGETAPHLRHLRGPGGQMMTQRYSGCATAAPTSGTLVRVVLMDMGWMMGGTGTMRLVAWPRVVSSGPVTFVATNHGRRTHELVVLPLGRRATDGMRVIEPGGRVSERGSLGEASRSCGAGAGDGIKAGTTGWVTLRLRPGRYELVCNLPHHYQRGMHATLVVR